MVHTSETFYDGIDYDQALLAYGEIADPELMKINIDFANSTTPRLPGQIGSVATKPRILDQLPPLPEAAAGIAGYEQALGRRMLEGCIDAERASELWSEYPR